MLVSIALVGTVFAATLICHVFLGLFFRHSARLSERLLGLRSRRRPPRRVREAWPDALMLLVGALRSGLSLEEAVEVFRLEAPEPLRSYLREKAGHEIQRLPFRKRVEILFDSRQLSLLRASLLLCHESGGRAADVVETAAQLLRQQHEASEKLKVFTAQGRMTAWIVGLTPFALLLGTSWISPDLMKPLFQTTMGWGVLAIILLLVSAGLFLVHRVVRLEP